MGKLPLSHYHDHGVHFFVFLKMSGRSHVTERETLCSIHHEEFRRSYKFNFSTVLYALRRFGEVIVENGQQVFMTEMFQQKIHELLSINEQQRAEKIADQIKIYSPEQHQFHGEKMSLRVDTNTENTVPLCINNTGSQALPFTGYKHVGTSSNISVEDKLNVTREKPLLLLPGDQHEVCKVKFSAQEAGVLSVKLTFEFGEDVCIERIIEARCETPLCKELAPTAPYRPRPPLRTSYSTQMLLSKLEIVDGQPPLGMYKRTYKRDFKIKRFKTPDERIMQFALTWENYKERFCLLLDLELSQMESDLQKANIPNENQQHVTMQRDPFKKELLILKVPGLTENHVSVLRGDHVLVRPVNETKKTYCLYVESVDQDTIKLGYNKELMDRHVAGMKFVIEFTLNTVNIEIQKRAVKLAVENELRPVLFPQAPPSFTPQQSPPRLILYDKNLEQNERQCQAVQHIVAGLSKPAPYLVFGPPGTGKTVTVAEAIKQILKSQPNSFILACAPTNSAADQLCENILKHVDKSKVLRIYAKYIKPSDVSNELQECSNLNGGFFDFPKNYKDKLMEYRVIISTLLTSSRMVTDNVPKGHFTHIFVDEAGHAKETECLLPISGLLNAESGQVVLAGDPKQLGPIIKSSKALKYGLGMSLLERLMTMDLYQTDKGAFDNRFVTKLLHNYRCHPSILTIPNELFYEGELKAFADKYVRNSYCNWEHLPQKEFPIIFHEVIGLNDRESSSPSLFNVAEVTVLMDYVKKLFQAEGKKGPSTLSPQHIGIIAPYCKQVQKIRAALQKVENYEKLKDISSIKVGTVEEFQGQERRVILLSTVRSSPEYTEKDKCNLGFVKNEKRFNVAITRAKALLIIVGNSAVLKSDPTWKRFIDYCKEKGGYRNLRNTK